MKPANICRCCPNRLSGAEVVLDRPQCSERSAFIMKLRVQVYYID